MSKKSPSIPLEMLQKAPMPGPGSEQMEKHILPEVLRCTERGGLVSKSTSSVKGIETVKRYLEHTCMTVASESHMT